MHAVFHHLAVSLLFSHSAALEPSTALLQRQNSPTNTDLIDPVLQPYCATSSCWHWSSPPPELCPLVQGPCANDTHASDNISAGDGGADVAKCGIHQYQRGCYCNLKTGLSCAWSCSWSTWWETEDWLERVCPDAPATKPVDFSGLPSCARQCLDDAVFQYGCLTQTSNCFCSRGDLFGCHEKCSDGGEWRQIERWLQEICDISVAAAAGALKEGKFSLSVSADVQGFEGANPPPVPARKPFSWDEIFVLTAASLAGFVGLATWIYHRCGRKIKGKLRLG